MLAIFITLRALRRRGLIGRSLIRRGPPRPTRGAALALVVLGAPLAATAAGGGPAQAGVGAKYGSRDPVVCARGVAPRGAPSPAQVAQLVRCGQYEKVSMGSLALTLVENVQVQVGPPRAYVHVKDSFDNIDVRQPLYPIRGAMRVYGCYPVLSSGGMIPGPGTRAELGDNRGRSCSYTEHPHATGVCYRDSFGDLHCTLADLSADNSSGPVPPPR